ncbi:hypothetical protein C0J52_26392 [Blattella germanica]|nr:hypothetical protein C0J52_26392 [Blattella germanica]
MFFFFFLRRDAFLVLSVAVLCSVANSAPQTDQVSDWLCPPPSSNPGDTALCDEPKCEQDIDCISESHSSSDNDTTSDRGCCFNGCVNTCTKKLEPPIAFDWLEEFRQNEEGKTEETPEKIEVAPLRHHAKTAPHAITTLPGGCVLTQRQYEELEGFRKHSHVEKCFCDKGGVSCEVSRKNMSLSDAA